jgi:hypothetical protein
MTDHLLAIDPGNVESAYVLIRRADLRPIETAKVGNETMRDVVSIYRDCADVYIEMIASYGKPVGVTVFETVLAIGRFVECAGGLTTEPDGRATLLYRRDVKLHLCHDGSAADSHVTQALIDRFAPYERNHGKGVKDAPGWFYGFKADIWQAYALGVYAADR